MGGEILQLQDEVFLLETLMDDLPDAMYFKDRESRLTRINRYAAAHYGIVNPALAVGRTDFDFSTEEHAGQALRDEQQIIRTGQPLVSIEEKETLPDGKLRWVSTTKRSRRRHRRHPGALARHHAAQRSRVAPNSIFPHGKVLVRQLVVVVQRRTDDVHVSKRGGRMSRRRALPDRSVRP